MSSKIFIKVESSQEQQENLRNSRKSLKVLQRASTDKENLVGRQLVGGPQKAFVKSKSENDFNDTSSSDIKRKKLTNPHLQHSSAGDDGAKPMPPRRSSELLRIIEEDLTKPDVDDETAVPTASADSLSVGYWRELAEKRRVALDVSLTENQELHEMNKSLRDQLDVSAAMLNESQNLVEILTEMLEEGDAAGTKEAGGYERGECSKSVLNASLAEEAEEVVEKVEEKTANDADDDESSNISSNTIVGEDETANGDDDNAQSRSGTH